MLKESLLQLDKRQLKQFYGILVHAWASQKAFISSQNFHNLWCELNYCCAQVDESFPDPYDDHKAIKDFCHFHPYYFIDRLPLELVAELFANYVDDRLDILTNFAETLSKADIRAAYTYMNDALGLSESIDDLVSETHTHIKFFSY